MRLLPLHVTLSSNPLVSSGVSLSNEHIVRVMEKTFIILIVLLSAGCSDPEPEPKIATVDDFEQHLKADMSYADFTRIFGEPNDDIGSGIHIYVYNFPDGTKILIGYVDGIGYARHVDANNQLIKVLI
jgi:hypothetical protein